VEVVRSDATDAEMMRAHLSIGALAALIDGDAARARRCLALWLTEDERARYARFEVPKRRRDWLAGRIVAKELVRRRHGLAGDDALRTIAIEAPDAGVHRGKPSYRVAGAPGPFDLSISHCRDYAVAALADAHGERIGIDIELVEPRDESFDEHALTGEERDALAQLDGNARALAVTQRWVLKEALAKALGIGMQLDFRRVTVELAGVHATFRTDRSLGGIVRARVDRAGTFCVGAVALGSNAATA
jgi:4'-phosphopantetheinyl transferase